MTYISKYITVTIENPGNIRNTILEIVSESYDANAITILPPKNKIVGKRKCACQTQIFYKKVTKPKDNNIVIQKPIKLRFYYSYTIDFLFQTFLVYFVTPFEPPKIW